MKALDEEYKDVLGTEMKLSTCCLLVSIGLLTCERLGGIKKYYLNFESLSSVNLKVILRSKFLTCFEKSQIYFHKAQIYSQKAQFFKKKFKLFSKISNLFSKS